MTGGQMIIEPPPLDDLRLYTYLQQMTRQINFALGETEKATITVVEKALSESAGETDKAKGEQQAREMLKLRGLIQQTATYVQEQMAEIRTTLTGEYVARSDIGQIVTEYEREIVQTAEGMLDKYKLDDLVESVDTGLASFRQYVTHTDGYIKTGFLYRDASGDEKLGVAVGENLTTVTVDGKEVLNREKLVATFTSDRLSFWQNEKEVAYVSNSKLYITNATITDELRVGNWIIKRDAEDYGLVIRYAQ